MQHNDVRSHEEELVLRFQASLTVVTSNQFSFPRTLPITVPMAASAEELVHAFEDFLHHLHVVFYRPGDFVYS